MMREEHTPDVLMEARTFLEAGEWDSPLPENYSLMATDVPEGWGANGEMMLRGYSLPEFACASLSWHLEKHEKQGEWGVYDVMP